MAASTHPRFKDKIACALLRFMALLPLSVLRAGGHVIGKLLWISNSRARQVTETNLAICFPDRDPLERRQLAQASLKHTCMTALEVAAIWLWPVERVRALVKSVSGDEYFQQALAHPQGMILLTPHLGNWEMVAAYTSATKQLTAMYAPGKLPSVDRLIYNGRSRFGCVMAPANPGGVRMVLKALKAGEMTGILPDQVPEEESGGFAPFFGRPALTMTLIATLARRTGAQVICCYAKRLQAEGGFEICFRPVQGDLAAENNDEALAALNRSVEACVRDCPEQYQWEYKRFRKQPAGLPKPY